MKGDSITEKGVWKCKQCAKEFRYESDMRRHELSHVPQFECERCSKKFSYLSALRRHEKTHERTSSVQCNQCGGHFRDEVLLKRHVRYSHKGTYKCDKCTATFNSEPALSTHKKTHKPESERRFRCMFGCGKSFNFSHHLKHHEMTHTNTKQHFCQTCGKGFIQYHHLKTHEKSHDPKYWLPCTVSDCKKKFVDEYARKRHLGTHRKTYNAGASSDSSLAKMSSEGSSDGKLKHTLRQKVNLSRGRNITVKCESTQEKGAFKTEILSLPLIGYESKDYKSSRFLEKGKLNERDDHLDNKDSDFVNDDIKTCKTAIGNCLVTGDSKTDQSCLCAKITNPPNDTDEEILIAPNNENLNVNGIEISEKIYESDCWLQDSIPDCNKKFVNDPTGISLSKHNGKMLGSPQQPIAIYSSGKHIIVECKTFDEQRAEVTKISNPSFIEYKHEDSQNNNMMKNCADGTESNSADNGVNMLRTAIDSCLITGDSYKDDGCVKISKPNETEEFVLASNNETIAVNTVYNTNGEVSTGTSVVTLQQDNSVVTPQQDFGFSTYEIVPKKCEGCQCANLCSISEKLACRRESGIEYIPGGIVKLKDTFDFDFQASAREEDRIKDVSDEINREIIDCNSSNFKSCKDVIGNCIVSGNSTMGEGCLCARMMVEDQAMAEEIDEITPCPQGAA